MGTFTWARKIIFFYFSWNTICAQFDNVLNVHCTIGCISRATLEISARWLNITIYQILCQRWFWEMLQFRCFLELFLLLQFQNHQWYRMVYIVIFNSLAGIPYVALLVRPMVHNCGYKHVLIWFCDHPMLCDCKSVYID